MLKGTQLLIGEEADRYVALCTKLRNLMSKTLFKEIVVPTIWEADTFKNKIQGETLGQMWTFQDKGGRDCCLIPEVTGLIQEIYNSSWSKFIPKPIRIFYITKCFRYERPQAGRLREFTQFGVEVLGGDKEKSLSEVLTLLYKTILPNLNIETVIVPEVKRGLGYYIEDGFEVTCPSLGAQSQIVGGGAYKEGVGWALGVERVLLGSR